MKRPKPGDVFEIETPKGLAYFQFTHKHSMYGELIRVLPGLFSKNPPDFAALVNADARFVTFFPLARAVRLGIVRVIGHVEVPHTAQAFPTFRMGGLIDPQTLRAMGWYLWSGGDTEIPIQLDEQTKQLPILEVINDTMLIELIVTNWTPATDRRN